MGRIPVIILTGMLILTSLLSIFFIDETVADDEETFHLFYAYDTGTSQNYEVYYATGNISSYTPGGNNPVLDGTDISWTTGGGRTVPSWLWKNSSSGIIYLGFNGYPDPLHGGSYECGITSNTVYDSTGWGIVGNQNTYDPITTDTFTDHCSYIRDGVWHLYYTDGTNGEIVYGTLTRDGINITEDDIPMDVNFTKHIDPLPGDLTGIYQRIDIGQYGGRYYMLTSNRTNPAQSQYREISLYVNSTGSFTSWEHVGNDPLISRGTNDWASYPCFLKDQYGNIVTYDGYFWILYTRGSSGGYWIFCRARCLLEDGVAGTYSKVEGDSGCLDGFTTTDRFSNPIWIYDDGGGEPPGGSNYTAPVITSMGYSGVYGLDNKSVVVGTFYVNFTYNDSATPSFFWLNISSDTGFESLIKNVNITDLVGNPGYYNCSISSGVTASTSKRYVHVRAFYGD